MDPEHLDPLNVEVKMLYVEENDKTMKTIIYMLKPKKMLKQVVIKNRPKKQKKPKHIKWMIREILDLLDQCYCRKVKQSSLLRNI